MDNQSRRFLQTWGLACVVLAAIVAAFNAVMDPYLVIGTPRIAHLNAYKPAVDTQERLMKAYDVLRARPSTLILGTSRVDLGLDDQNPAWPADNRPVYNLGLVGAGLYTSYRYLQHVISQQKLTLVVLGLDFEFFLTIPMAGHPTDTEFEARFSVTRDGGTNNGWRAQRVRDSLKATLSFDALADSAATLTENIKQSPSDFAAGIVPDGYYRRMVEAVGSYGIFAMRNVMSVHDFSNQHINALVMNDLRAILDFCRSHNTPLILIINPVHADMLEMLDTLGYWETFETWKRDVLGVAAEYGSTAVSLWDFTAYDAYSTETVPTDRQLMTLFWDPSHYRRALGDMIISRIFTSGNPHFGTLLTPQNIDSHLADIRHEQLVYRASHHADVRRVRQLYEAIANTPSPRAAKAQ